MKEIEGSDAGSEQQNSSSEGGKQVSDYSIKNQASIFSTIDDTAQREMTKHRPRKEVTRLFPVFSDAIQHLNTIDKPRILDLGSGQGRTLQSLLEKFPHARMQGVDKNQSIKKHLDLRDLRITLLQRDVDNQDDRERIPGNQDFINSAFVAMYLKNPLKLATLAQEKLSQQGRAALHLGYTQQFSGGKQTVEDILSNIPKEQISYVTIPQYFIDADTQELLKRKVDLEAILLTIDKHTPLQDLAKTELTATQGFGLIDQEKSLMIKNSDLWYTYEVK